MSDAQNSPFKSFGQRLRFLRQKFQETPADVSGAVEIDEDLLQRYEEGTERPSEDILQLLMSHFCVPDDDAATIWRLAGYDEPRENHQDYVQDDIPGGRAGVMIMAIDPRIIYTDGVHVNASQTGVVLSFAQMNGSQQPLVTARVGMSREQARSVISNLQGALDRTEQRQLPSPRPKDPRSASEQQASDSHLDGKTVQKDSDSSANTK